MLRALKRIIHAVLQRSRLYYVMARHINDCQLCVVVPWCISLIWPFVRVHNMYICLHIHMYIYIYVICIVIFLRLSIMCLATIVYQLDLAACLGCLSVQLVCLSLLYLYPFGYPFIVGLSVCLSVLSRLFIRLSVWLDLAMSLVVYIVCSSECPVCSEHVTRI